MKPKARVYLAGAIERAPDLGVGWRNELTPILEGLGIEVVDPCKEEGEKLKGFQPNRRFPSFKHWSSGETVEPKHWHEAKDAPTNSDQLKRFCRYMKTIIKEDLKLVDSVDFLIVRWDKYTRQGAGTFHEIVHSGLSKPVYVVAEDHIPAWLVPFIVINGERFANFDELKDFLQKEYGDL